jgi:hypothetical protein
MNLPVNEPSLDADVQTVARRKKKDLIAIQDSNTMLLDMPMIKLDQSKAQPDLVCAP